MTTTQRTFVDTPHRRARTTPAGASSRRRRAVPHPRPAAHRPPAPLAELATAALSRRPPNVTHAMTHQPQ